MQQFDLFNVVSGHSKYKNAQGMHSASSGGRSFV